MADKKIQLDFVENWKLFCGDALETLKTIEDNSIDCCVTSPPYYGLRDYGTGHWEGGDPNCDHEAAKLSTRFDRTMTEKSKVQMRNKGTDVKRYMAVCPKCGAVRVDEQIGLEQTPEEYVQRLVDVFHEVKRIMKPTGTCWINIGDTYNTNSYKKDAKSSGHGKQGTNRGSYENVVVRPMAENCKVKDLIGTPWMLAFALRNDGWYLRQDIIWAKPNPMPEPVKDRCTRSHEHIFLLSKSEHYFYDNEAIQEEAKYAGDDRGARTDSRRGTNMNSVSGDTGEFRNKRDVWNIPTGGGYTDGSGAHFATYSPKLIEPCVLAGCPVGGVVLDPFNGTGTTGVVAMKLSRKYVGIELNEEYYKMSTKRLERESSQYCLFDM